MTEHPHQNNLSKATPPSFKRLPLSPIKHTSETPQHDFHPLIICILAPSSLLSKCYSHPKHLHFLLSSWEALNAGAQDSDANGAQLQASPFTSSFNFRQIVSSGIFGSSFANEIKKIVFRVIIVFKWSRCKVFRRFSSDIKLSTRLFPFGLIHFWMEPSTFIGFSPSPFSPVLITQAHYIYVIGMTLVSQII